MNPFIYISVQDATVSTVIKPIMEPGPIAFAFDTIGWTLLLWLVIISVIIFIIRGLISYQKNKYKRDAIKILSNLKLESSFESNQQIAAQLKIVAIKSYGRETVAHLSGKEWTSFLESKGTKIEFNNLDTFLLECLYQNKSDTEKTKRFLTYSKKWINSHA